MDIVNFILFGDIVGSVPNCHNKASITIKQTVIFAGGGVCLPFVKEHNICKTQ